MITLSNQIKLKYNTQHLNLDQVSAIDELLEDTAVNNGQVKIDDKNSHYHVVMIDPIDKYHIRSLIGKLEIDLEFVNLPVGAPRCVFN